MPKELLIADPNVTAQQEFESIFEGTDSQLIFAENGEDALLKVKLYKPDLVIADVTMPNKNGFELCKIVKANSELKNIPFVLLAGIFEEIDKSEQAKIGADGVITKPLKADVILPLIKDLLKTKPIPLQAEKKTEPEAAEVGAEEVLPSMEELPTLEGLEEIELAPPEEVLETGSRSEGEEEKIIELTEVVEEETAAGAPSGERLNDISLEQAIGGQEDLIEETPLDEESLEGIDFGEPSASPALEEVELEGEGGPTEESREIEEADTDLIEDLEWEAQEEEQRAREEEKPSREAARTELEEEIDQHIDLVLDEEKKKEEEDTLLELEGAEEKAVSLEETEELKTLSEEIVRPETPESAGAPDESLRDEEEILLGLNETEALGEEPKERVSPEELLGNQFGQSEEGEGLEPSSGKIQDEAIEELSEALEEVSDDLEKLTTEGVEDLEETVEELEELPFEDELESLPGEKLQRLQEQEEEGPGERLEEKESEKGGELPSEEHAGIEEIVEEISEGESIGEGIDEKGFVDVETESTVEAADLEAIEEAGEESLEELREGLSEESLEEGEGFIEEPGEEPLEEPAEPVSYPTELIKEEHISEEELEAFQKRLSTDQETLESTGGLVNGKTDERVESAVRKTVEEVVRNISERVVPELSRTIVQMASEQIEKVVQEVVPEMAEGAIKKEIERLQKRR